MQADPTNLELYRLALADAPFVIAGYGVLWVAFVVYVTMVLRRILKMEREVVLLEDAVNRRTGSSDSKTA